MLKRYHKGLEQTLVILPQGAAVAQAVAAPFKNAAALDFSLAHQPAAAVPDRIPARHRVAVTGRHQHRAAAQRNVLQDSARTRPPTWCAVHVTTRASTCRASARPHRGSAAATSRTCRWAPTRGTAIRTRCSTARRRARVAISRCKPGMVIPAPSINNGQNPLPADQLPRAGTASSATRCRRPAVGRCSAAASNPTRASTLRHQAIRRSTTRRAVKSSDPTESSTPSAVRPTQETTDGRRCWHQPAEPRRPTSRLNLNDAAFTDDAAAQPVTTGRARGSDSRGWVDRLRARRCWCSAPRWPRGGYFALRSDQRERRRRAGRDGRDPGCQGLCDGHPGAGHRLDGGQPAEDHRLRDRRFRCAGRTVQRCAGRRVPGRPRPRCRCRIMRAAVERHNDGRFDGCPCRASGQGLQLDGAGSGERATGCGCRWRRTTARTRSPSSTR